MDAQRVIADLRELAARTSTAEGAQRLAWGPVWRDAREWFRNKVLAMGLGVEADSAGNNWVTLRGRSPKTVIVGSHLDSVPNGGWLDGSLGVLAALEALRARAGATPPVTLKLVDWADEEGARFGRSLLGSSAAAGSLNIEDVRELTDRQGTKLVDALAENGVSLDRMVDAHRELKAIDARAYLELHIEQGPVLESMKKPTGVVTGTFGVERHMLRFTGQAAHSGSTPIPMRRDAFLAAAETALECRAIATRHSKPGAGVVCTVGVVNVEPKIVTAVPGVCEISLDQRAPDADVLAAMHHEARVAAERFARENNVGVEWKHLWRIDPRPFDPHLVRLCEEAVREETGDAPRLPSGPLHDAAEMAPHMPVAMMFSYSSSGLSHCKEEDTPGPHLEKTIRAYLRLVEKTVAHVAAVASTAVLAFALGTPLVAQDAPLPAADPFLAQVRARLQTDRRLLSQYTYLERRSEIHLTKLGKVATGPVKVYQVYPGLDPDDRYHRLIEVDGKPREGAELEKEDRRRQRSVLERLRKREQESAAGRENRLRREAKSRQEEQETLDDLLRVYAFRLVERQMRDGHSTIVVDFAPKRDAAPTTDYGKLMKKVKGRAWVSENDYQVARVEVEMLDDLSVGLGLLGKLYKGTTASFDREKINDEVWLPAEARFTGSGRALIRKFRIDTVVRYSDYRKFSVETDTSFTLPKQP